MAGIIAKENMRAGVQAADWREAIRQAGGVLEAAGSITSEYTESMIKAVEEMGPYIVIMPGFAIAHAAPAPSVLKEDIALITLAQPVSFGSPNDPVNLMLCVACVDRESHVRALQAVAEVLCEDGIMDRLAAAASVEELEQILNAAG
jgi:PTS system ascorbate-specific IIA component